MRAKPGRSEEGRERRRGLGRVVSFMTNYGLRLPAVCVKKFSRYVDTILTTPSSIFYSAIHLSTTTETDDDVNNMSNTLY